MSISARWVIRAAQFGLASLLASIGLTACVGANPHRSGSSPLPLQPVGEVALPGNNSRFDYASLDQRSRAVVHRPPGCQRGRSRSTCTPTRWCAPSRTSPRCTVCWSCPSCTGSSPPRPATIRWSAIDEDTGAVLVGRRPAQYPDGLAYDPHTQRDVDHQRDRRLRNGDRRRHGCGARDRGSRRGGRQRRLRPRTSTGCWSRCRAAAISRSIDPAALTVSQRIALPGCDHPHGLAWTRPPARRSWRATATPPCSASTSTSRAGHRHQPGRRGPRRAGLRPGRASPLCRRRKRRPSPSLDRRRRDTWR